LMKKTKQQKRAKNNDIEQYYLKVSG